MSDEKEAAKEARRLPEVERTLALYLKQGSPVNVSAYKTGWCRAFGRKTQEHGDGTIGEKVCADEYCWCKS